MMEMRRVVICTLLSLGVIALRLLKGLQLVEGFVMTTGSKPSARMARGARLSSTRSRRGFLTPLRGAGVQDSKSGQEELGSYEKVKGMLDEDTSMDYIFENNRKWVEASLDKDPETFSRLAKSQHPKYLYIGCSDSRVPAQNMMGLNTGELFVIRNVANLCVNTDHSLLAALTFAVENLEVTDIVVCGHYGCGGVRAAMENVDHGLLEHWLSNIRNVQRLHLEELQGIPDVNARHRRLVELNVQESCMNLFANPIVQKKQATSAQPKIHGWVYDVATGRLKKLDIDFKSEIRKYRDVYRLYEFPRRPSAGNDQVVARKRDPSARVAPREPKGSLMDSVP